MDLKRYSKSLKERRLWLTKNLNLNCPKLKYSNCQVAADYKICVKGYKYDIYKIFCQCNLLNYLKNRQCDAYIHREEIC